jgi:hypothetical protein
MNTNPTPDSRPSDGKNSLNTASGVPDQNQELLAILRGNFEAVHNRIKAIQLEPRAMAEVTRSLDPTRLTLDATSNGIYAPILGRLVTGSPVLLKLGAAKVVSHAAAADQALSPELAALAGALYFYVRLTDHDRMVASSVLNYYMLKRAHNLDEAIDHTKKVYAAMAQEPSSAFKALLVGELNDTNRLGETKFLAGILQPMLGLLTDRGESTLASIKSLWTRGVSDHLKDLSVGYLMTPAMEELMVQWSELPTCAPATQPAHVAAASPPTPPRAVTVAPPNPPPATVPIVPRSVPLPAPDPFRPPPPARGEWISGAAE